MKSDSNKSVFAIGGSLALFLLLSYAANEAILNENAFSSHKRSPASSAIETLRSGSMDAERKLASQLSELKTRALASLGHNANPFDQFRFGILEGKYAFTLDGEKIKDVSFVDTPESEGSPTRVTDRVEFLKNNSQILNIKNKVEKVSTDIKGRKIIETYKAFLKDSNRIIMVQMELDELDRLYQINLL